jgi:hypothetical protein
VQGTRLYMNMFSSTPEHVVLLLFRSCHNSSHLHKSNAFCHPPVYESSGFSYPSPLAHIYWRHLNSWRLDFVFSTGERRTESLLSPQASRGRPEPSKCM